MLEKKNPGGRHKNQFVSVVETGKIPKWSTKLNYYWEKAPRSVGKWLSITTLQVKRKLPISTICVVITNFYKDHYRKEIQQLYKILL